MKSLKMLMMAALTILSIAVLAQDTTSKKAKKHKTEKALYVCPVHQDISGRKRVQAACKAGK